MVISGLGMDGISFPGLSSLFLAHGGFGSLGVLLKEDTPYRCQSNVLL